MAVQKLNCLTLLESVQASEDARAVFEEYSASKNYEKYNKVAYKGSSYVCKVPCKGKLPTDTTYWLLMAAKGEAGHGLDIMGTYATKTLLEANVTSPEQGDIYQVGSTKPYTLYMWDTTKGNGTWLELGQLQGPTGDKGDTGDKGEKGDKGDTGEKGEKGDNGNVLFATFNIDPASGELSITVPAGFAGMTFSVNDNGFMEVTI